MPGAAPARWTRWSRTAGDPPLASEQPEGRPPPEGYAGIGYTGASPVGVLAEAFTVRRGGSTGSVCCW